MRLLAGLSAAGKGGADGDRAHVWQGHRHVATGQEGRGGADVSAMPRAAGAVHGPQRPPWSAGAAKGRRLPVRRLVAAPHVLPVAALGVAHHLMRVPRPLVCLGVNGAARVAGVHVEAVHRHVLLLHVLPLHVGVAVVRQHALLVLGPQVARQAGVHHGTAAGCHVPHRQQERCAVRCRQTAEPCLSTTADAR